jgi:peptidoglycan/LPS O-acetylase OafA/YrhL
LLLPALALLGAALRLRMAGAWAFIGCVIAAGMLLRAGLWSGHVDAHEYGIYFYYKLIYYASLCRLDELVAGVALALVKNRHPDLWTRMTSHGNRALAAGVVVLGATFWLFLDNHFSFAATVFGYPLLGLGFGLLILAALSQRSLLRDLRVPGAGALAVWSYAIYLTHRGVGEIAAGRVQDLGYGPQTPLAIVVLLALSVLVGWMLYRLVETPFMALRERYVPSNLAQPGLSPAPR